MPDRVVDFELFHRDFTDAIRVQLQTDERGRIELGELPQIRRIAASRAGGVTRNWDTGSDRHTHYRTLYAVEGSPIQVPLLREATAQLGEQVSLLEYRGGLPVADRLQNVHIADGFATVSGLSAGDYVLRLKQDQQSMHLRIASGRSDFGYALGANQQLELRGSQQLQIEKIEVGTENVQVHLANSSPFARLHVFATRFAPEYDAFQALSQVRDAEPQESRWATRPALYAAGRDIGDEYRYIIDRKYAQKFPGNMLRRPSLLLNPWALQETETDRQELRPGGAFDAEAESLDAPPAPSARMQASGAIRDVSELSACYDFLSAGSAIIVNLRPDETGKVLIDRQQLGPHQHLHFVAVDPVSTAYRSVSLPELPMPMNDLRLADGLAAEKHYTRRKQVTIVKSGDEFQVDDITSSKFAYYDSLQGVFKLYQALSKDENLNEFEFITRWPALSDDGAAREVLRVRLSRTEFLLVSP